MAANSNPRLAVLIDSDNAHAAIPVIDELMAEVSRYGTATIRRAYGDWTTDNLKKWKAILHKQAIQPIQQFSYTSGKNSTDSALIIDAMDILHAGNVDGFCLVSSDSDFTRLATRIREAGLTAYGFGERKTPDPFVAACDKFIYIEILRPEPEEVKAAPGDDLGKLKPLMLAAVDANVRDDGWAALGGIGSHIGKVLPAFDPRNYGFKKLSDLVRGLSYIEVKDVPITRPDGATMSNVMVRLKRATR
jgi:uncharacterized LabA/DUF88 family protein